MENSQVRLVVSSDNSPQKAFLRALKFSIFAIVLGIAVTFVGYILLEDLTYFSKDSEEWMAIGVFAVGIILVVLGIVFPVAARITAGKCKIDVFEDHIEGKAFKVVANTQTLMDFYETYDKISSVSTAKNIVSINLLSGNSIRCTAFNAEQVSKAIRGRIV